MMKFLYVLLGVLGASAVNIPDVFITENAKITDADLKDSEQ
jgi:hypothetical protein